MAILFKTDGTSLEVEPDNGKDFGLKELYTILDCELIEIVYLPDKIMLVVDEEGKLQNKPVNLQVTVLANISDDYIVGNALLCKHKQLK